MTGRANPRIKMIIAAGEDEGDTLVDPAAAPPADDDDPDAAPPAPTPDEGEPTAPLPSPNGRFHAIIILEETDTGDKRWFTAGSLGWRNLPLPLMADDTNHPEHLDSVLVGNFDRIERVGNEIHGWGAYLSNPNERAGYLIGLIKLGELRGISGDVDSVEFDIMFPVDPDVLGTDADGNPEIDYDAMYAERPPIEEKDGQPYEVMSIEQPLMRVTEGRVMGATVVPFPALQEAWIEDEAGVVALAASAAPAMRDARITGVLVAAVDTAPTVLPGREAAPARFTFPDIPPASWFETPETPGPMPLTITDDGQVFGHLALWGECHIGITGECVEPPPSPSNYARFHVGEIPVSDGGRVAVGRLTFGNGGHADRGLNAAETAAHYDRTCQVAADIVATDGEYGIWVCGAMRSKLSLADVREVMSAPPSGDWRRIGRDLEMVAALCVNVPGFNTPRTAILASGREVVVPASGVLVRKEDGLIASLIVSHPAPPRTVTASYAALDPSLAAALRNRIALSIGRTPDRRRAELVARIRGGK